jgi:hypothetical protein
MSRKASENSNVGAETQLSQKNFENVDKKENTYDESIKND